LSGCEDHCATLDGGHADDRQVRAKDRKRIGDDDRSAERTWVDDAEIPDANIVAPGHKNNTRNKEERAKERLHGGASLSALIVSAWKASFIPLHTVVNANLTVIDDHNFDRRAILRN
jgi:hypothetical protein